MRPAQGSLKTSPISRIRQPAPCLVIAPSLLTSTGGLGAGFSLSLPNHAFVSLWRETFTCRLVEVNEQLAGPKDVFGPPLALSLSAARSKPLLRIILAQPHIELSDDGIAAFRPLEKPSLRRRSAFCPNRAPRVRASRHSQGCDTLGRPRVRRPSDQRRASLSSSSSRGDNVVVCEPKTRHRRFSQLEDDGAVLTPTSWSLPRPRVRPQPRRSRSRSRVARPPR